MCGRIAQETRLCMRKSGERVFVKSVEASNPKTRPELGPLGLPFIIRVDDTQNQSVTDSELLFIFTPFAAIPYMLNHAFAVGEYLRVFDLRHEWRLLRFLGNDIVIISMSLKARDSVE